MHVLDGLVDEGSGQSLGRALEVSKVLRSCLTLGLVSSIPCECAASGSVIPAEWGKAVGEIPIDVKCMFGKPENMSPAMLGFVFASSLRESRHCLCLSPP